MNQNWIKISHLGVMKLEILADNLSVFFQRLPPAKVWISLLVMIIEEHAGTAP
jgi:hypothetical protein